MIVVNATALDKSGALSILRQFIKNMPDDNHRWLIFVSPTIDIGSKNSNVRIEPISNVKSMHKRLWWDIIGLKRWLRKNDIDPVAAVSLQNTGFNVGKKVPNFIYYHQSIPFYPFRWNPLKKSERSFWFYKHIYPYFVNLFLKRDTKIFVQLQFVKDGFANRFKHSKEFIGVYNPEVTLPEIPIEQSNDIKSKIKLLYPAMPHFYKNHRVIEEALKLSDLDIEIVFTISRNCSNVKDDRIKLIGMQSYKRISELYNICDALLFPSYIETFGLPLLEAAMTGMPIIAADLPYAREVLQGYEGVTFVPYDQPQAWAKAIHEIEKGKRYNPLDISKRSGWKELFNDIKSSL